MDTDRELVEALRQRIIGRLHVGLLQPGDRLASIREVARESGADHRAVARAYRALEEERLVEIRPGSGVYVAPQERFGGGVLSETIHWLTDVWVEAWERRITPAQLLDLVRRSTASRLVCACVESTEDHMVAVSAELRDCFGLDVVEVYVSGAADSDTVGLDNAIGDADLVVTTAFHADRVRGAAARWEKPFVVATVNSLLVQEINNLLKAGRVTAVVADPRFRERVERFFRGTVHEGRIRVVLVEEVETGAEWEGGEGRVVLTRAARRRLGRDEFHLLPPPIVFLDRESARRVAEVVIPLNLEKTRSGAGR